MSNKTESMTSLPKELEKIAEDFTWKNCTMGYSGTKVFKLTKNQNILYLKIGSRNSVFNLKKEKIILEWISDKLPVPEVLYFKKENSKEFLLLSEIKGKAIHIIKSNRERRNAISILAEGLKKIHTINPSYCPTNNNPDRLLELTRTRLRKGHVDSSKFDKRWSDKNPEQLFEGLLKLKPKEYDLVFSHGDYCLPNVLINNNQLSGIIDWPYGGVNDRYFDLAAVTWSISFNYGEEWVKYFFQDYGIDKIDWDRIFFFQMLNEFFQQ